MSDNGHVFNVTVVNNAYTAVLPNNHTYTAQVKWILTITNGPPGQVGDFSGQCPGGIVTVDAPAGTSKQTNNLSC